MECVCSIPPRECGKSPHDNERTRTWLFKRMYADPILATACSEQSCFLRLAADMDGCTAVATGEAVYPILPLLHLSQFETQTKSLGQQAALRFTLQPLKRSLWNPTGSLNTVTSHSCRELPANNSRISTVGEWSRLLFSLRSADDFVLSGSRLVLAHTLQFRSPCTCFWHFARTTPIHLPDRANAKDSIYGCRTTKWESKARNVKHLAWSSSVTVDTSAMPPESPPGPPASQRL